MLSLTQWAEFGERLGRQAKTRRGWASKNRVSCFRLYDREWPEYPFVIDQYEDRFVWFLVIDEEDGVEEGLAEAARTWGVDRQRIVLKVRRRQRGSDQYEKLDEKKEQIIVREGGLKFLVNLSDYLDTGLFLDHRWSRSYVRDLSAGRKVLNLFCYTGSFSVYAAHGGAFETVSVDLNPNYLDWSRENFRLNGLEGPSHKFVKRDAVEFLRSESTLKFDVIVLDPPTFSNSKKMDGTLDVQRDHSVLLSHALRMLTPDGVVFFSTNAQTFKFQAPSSPTHKVQEVTKFTLPSDVRKGSHRSWLLTRPDAPELVLKRLENS